MASSPHPDHDRGLEFDLSMLVSRRRSLGLFLGAGAAAALAACTPASTGGGTASATASAGTGRAAGTAAAGPAPTLTRAIAECGVEIPDETAGPYPGDGSNGPNALEASGVVRRDITSSFGSSSEAAEGVPLEFTLNL